MGGSNEIRIGMLRVHESGSEVHVHDDKAGVKFAMDAGDFETSYGSLKSMIKSGRPDEQFMIDDKGVKLIARVTTKIANKFRIAWSVEAPAPIYDFDSMDAFVGNL